MEQEQEKPVKAKEDSTIEQLYQHHFSPQVYVSEFYSEIDLEEEFFLSNIHEFFESVPSFLCTMPRIVVEIGSGPIISGLVSASRWADLLVYSDLLPSNCNHILSSLSSPGPAIKTIARLEDSAPHLVLTRLLAKPVLVTESNLFSRPVLPHLGFGTKPSIVLAKLCIEFAVTELEQFWSVLQNIAALLDTHGVFVCMGALNESYYMLGKKKFPAFALTKELMNTGLEKAGMEMVLWKEVERSSNPDQKPTGHSGLYFMYARKTKC